MNVIVNGDATTLPDTVTTVETLLQHLDLPQTRGIALAINDQVIPKSEWARNSIAENDRIEIIAPFSGG